MAGVFLRHGPFWPKVGFSEWGSLEQKPRGLPRVTRAVLYQRQFLKLCFCGLVTDLRFWRNNAEYKTAGPQISPNRPRIVSVGNK